MIEVDLTQEEFEIVKRQANAYSLIVQKEFAQQQLESLNNEIVQLSRSLSAKQQQEGKSEKDSIKEPTGQEGSEVGGE